MTAFGQDDRLRSGDQALEGEGVFPGNELVVVAPKQQRRHVDAMQPFAQMRIVAARLPHQPCAGGPVLEVGVLELRPLRRGDHRLGAVLVVEQVADALLVGAQEGIDLLHAVDMDAGGADERQRSEAGELRTASSAAIQPPSELPIR